MVITDKRIIFQYIYRPLVTANSFVQLDKMMKVIILLLAACFIGSVSSHGGGSMKVLPRAKQRVMSQFMGVCLNRCEQQCPDISTCVAENCNVCGGKGEKNALYSLTNKSYTTLDKSLSKMSRCAFKNKCISKLAACTTATTGCQTCMEGCRDPMVPCVFDDCANYCGQSNSGPPAASEGRRKRGWGKYRL